MKLSWILIVSIPVIGGCGFVKGLLGGDPAQKDVEQAQAELAKGEIPAALATYDAAFKAHPESIDAAIGVAYGAYLQGEFEAADKVLASVEAKAEERKGEIIVRRALVALALGDLDKVRTLGTSSALPAGQLLAAEVALADGERDAAITLLNTVSTGTGVSADVARSYLGLMNDADVRVQGLSEAQALWALGQRKVAVRSVEELVKNLPEERADKNEILVLWAGRAAAAGETLVATNLIQGVAFPPSEMIWRHKATQAIIACAEGDGASCASQLDTLEAIAPPEGLRDARATAAILLAPNDPAKAREIAGTDASPVVARALWASGDPQTAAGLAGQGPLSRFLSQGGG